jgi:hypothetical protein
MRCKDRPQITGLVKISRILGRSFYDTNNDYYEALFLRNLAIELSKD